ncbi:MAG: hypothetical protein L3J10_09945 [Sulfurimonas sp.]|nr:hypothetical protein [Sulfurimonas sp.]
MDSAIIYSLFGIFILVSIIIFTLNSKKPKDVKSKNQKKAEILNIYKIQLQKALAPLKNDKDAKLNKKSDMLKKISNELSRNIFFDNDEVRDIIAELAK